MRIIIVLSMMLIGCAKESSSQSNEPNQMLPTDPIVGTEPLPVDEPLPDIKEPTKSVPIEFKWVCNKKWCFTKVAYQDISDFKYQCIHFCKIHIEQTITRDSIGLYVVSIKELIKD